MEINIMEEFEKAERPDFKLSFALYALEEDNNLKENEIKILLDYLKSRKIPAIQELIRQNNLHGLKEVKKLGWIEKSELNGYREQARKLELINIWAFLMEEDKNNDPIKNNEENEVNNIIDKDNERKENYYNEKIIKLLTKKFQIRFPNMWIMFAKLKWNPSLEVKHLSSDGFFIFYNPKNLKNEFIENSQKLIHTILHILIHQLYLDPILSIGKNKRLWNIACDMTVEETLDNWKLNYFEKSDKNYRSFLKKELGLPNTWKNTNILYNKLLKIENRLKDLIRLEDAYEMDDHISWLKYDKRENKNNTDKCSGNDKGRGINGGMSNKVRNYLNKWNNYSKEWKLNPNENTQHKPGSSQGNSIQEVQLEKKSEYDYHKFLEQFMLCKEEIEVDMDSIDYIPYYYSRENYDKVIFIEPLEYKEIYRLYEMVIAIDTSGSCSGKVVKQFLEETYRIITEKGNFFNRMNVHIIQCDSYVQEHVIIHNKNEFLEYMENFKVNGLGGTDFRPVFKLVDKMIKEKEFNELKGLIYFTDGDGIFPEKAPEYETAFVFLNNDYEKHKLPKWAIRLNLGLKLEKEEEN